MAQTGKEQLQRGEFVTVIANSQKALAIAHRNNDKSNVERYQTILAKLIAVKAITGRNATKAAIAFLAT